MIQFFYGHDQRYLDITDKVFASCFDGERLFVPGNDNVRASLFSDPAYRVKKNIVVIRDDSNGEKTCSAYNSETTLELTPTQDEIRSHYTEYPQSPPKLPAKLSTVDDKIEYLHSVLKFAGAAQGLEIELPEQRMIVGYLDPKAKVLEIGANIGRSTLTIASVLNNPKNFVSLECDPTSVELLRNNKFANGFNFHIEPSAISYRKLIQRGWITKPSDTLEPGYNWIQTITFEELKDKYGIKFDTLVADCEGALYYILNDSKALLKNIKKVILEADFYDVEHKKSVEAIFDEFGLKKIYSEPLRVSFRHQFPAECAESFFEVWTKD